jgi:hypothetical protein
MVPTTDDQHFFVKYLFILENEVRQFQIEFSRISRVEEQACKIHRELCFGTNNFFQVGTLFLLNFNKYPEKILFFSARPLEMCQTSVIGRSLLVMHKSGIFCIKVVIISQADNSHGNQEISTRMIGMSMNKVQKLFLDVKERTPDKD